MVGEIYKFTNIINGKVYIGKTINIDRRLKEHKYRSKYHKNKFGYALTKYGFDSFIFESILSINSTNKSKLNIILNILEKSFIQKYNSYYNGYNSTLGGDGCLGTIKSQESKDALSKLKVGKSINKGNKASLDTKIKLSKLSVERYKDIRKKPKSIFKNLMTDSCRKLQSIKKKKAIQQFTLDNTYIQDWDSALDASIILDIQVDTIRKCCKNTRKTAGGFTWKYK